MKFPGKPVIAITVGDCNGVGPEVILKSIHHPSVRKCCIPLLIGPPSVFEYYARKFLLPLRLCPIGDRFDFASQATPIVALSSVPAIRISPGKLSRGAGAIAARAIENAVGMLQKGKVHAMVTGPVSKQSLHLAGVDFPGQTEMVQKLSGSSRVAMMLVSKTMRVGLVTIHVPLDLVAGMITRSLLREKIEIIHAALKSDWNIRSPKIAVLGLNPHASEGGDIGREDIDIVGPVVQEFHKQRIHVEGPFPADSFFGRYKPDMYDAVVAMYHDQGLVPLKMSSFGRGVNISVGLNIVRTSPDHGTAFDIAGQDIANPGSMIEAIILAASVAINRGLVPGRRKKAA